MVSSALFMAVAKFIDEHIGMMYGEANAFQLEKRILKIIEAMDLKGEAELMRKFEKGLSPAERQLVIDIACNNETLFFRDIKIFNALQNYIIPELTARQKVISFWSCCCSTGQEPYSIAMVMEEKFSGIQGIDYSILATDISDLALEHTKAGIYSQLELSRGLPPSHLDKYFVKKDDLHWQVSNQIKKNITTKKINILDRYFDVPKVDVIFLRNVLIYQTIERKKQIVDRMVGHLKPGGFLVLGSAENLLGVTDKLDQVFKQGVIYYQNKPSEGLSKVS